MGYPYNLDFDFEAIRGLNDYCINNLGDPFIESNYGVHSRPFEVSKANSSITTIPILDRRAAMVCKALGNR